MMRDMTGQGEIATPRSMLASNCSGQTSAMASSMNSSCLSAASMLSVLLGAQELVIRPTDGLGGQVEQPCECRELAADAKAKL